MVKRLLGSAVWWCCVAWICSLIILGRGADMVRGAFRRLRGKRVAR